MDLRSYLQKCRLKFILFANLNLCLNFFVIVSFEPKQTPKYFAHALNTIVRQLNSCLFIYFTNCFDRNGKGLLLLIFIVHFIYLFIHHPPSNIPLKINTEQSLIETKIYALLIFIYLLAPCAGPGNHDGVVIMFGCNHLLRIILWIIWSHRLFAILFHTLFAFEEASNSRA